MLEINLSKGPEDMGVKVSMQLDVSTKYQYFDKNEVRWVFSYQVLGGEEGWFVWITRPGQTEICIGMTTEGEIIKKLDENPPLSIDDFIDLELWIKHGGLDEYLPRKEN